MDKAKFFQVVWKHIGQYAEKVANGTAGCDTTKCRIQETDLHFQAA